MQVTMSKVNLDTIKPWITQQITDILQFEDDVITEFIFNQLEVEVIASFESLLCLLQPLHSKYVTLCFCSYDKY